MTSHPYTVSRPSRLTRWLTLSSLLLLWALLAVSQAAVTSAITGDGTLGTTVTQSGRTYAIGGGTLRGSNLFQSFERFSVGTGDTATFTGPTGTTNILNRVTGGQQSVIDGRLQSIIPGANLYLLNPSGVLFGPDASLNVSGSFHVSTADFLRLADGAQFHANPGQESRLTVAPPAAFGFLGNNPAAITMQGSGLVVPTGRALSVVGGDITLAGGGLGAPSGRIQLTSVASPGDVVFSPLAMAPDLHVEGFARLGRIAVSEGANVTVSSPAQGPMSSRPGAGTVLIRGGRLLVDNAFVNANTTGAGEGARLGIDVRLAEDLVLTNGGQLIADSRGAGRAGELRLTAGSLRMDDALVGSRPSASGDGGNIRVNVGNLMLTGGAQIDSSTRSGSVGRGGDLTVIATEAITIAGRDREGNLSGLFSNTVGSGDAGHLFVSTPTLQMEGGIIVANTMSEGAAGNLEVRVDRLALTGGPGLIAVPIVWGAGGS